MTFLLVDSGFTGQPNFSDYGLAPDKVATLVERNEEWIAFARRCHYWLKAESFRGRGKIRLPALTLRQTPTPCCIIR